MNGKKAKRIIVAAALVAVLAISGISAYFTDGDTATNTFTVGKVEIDLQEPGWTGAVSQITPEQEFEKKPQVKNTGVNDAFVFLEVVVPYENVKTVNDDGTTKTTAFTELFSYDVKNGWVEVGTAVKNESAKTSTHLYAYGTSDVMTALEANVTTDTLFDWVKFANVVEDQGLETNSKDVIVNAYAIQTANINDGKNNLDGVNNDGTVKPSEVWAVLNAQAPLKDKTGEDANTDIIP